MPQPINMLQLRRQVGQIIDETFYRKDRFVIKRKDKPVAMLIPIEDYQFLLCHDRDIELYTNKRIQEFSAADKLTSKQKARAARLLLPA